MAYKLFSGMEEAMAGDWVPDLWQWRGANYWMIMWQLVTDYDNMTHVTL